MRLFLIFAAVSAMAHAANETPNWEKTKAPEGVPPPKVVLCRVSVPVDKKESHGPKILEQYLISDSDGYELCAARGGEAFTGGYADRNVMNIKETLRK